VAAKFAHQHGQNGQDDERTRQQQQQRQEEAGAQERQRQQEEQGRRADSSSGKMTVDQALEILGLGARATEEEIRAAHKRLMQRVHPDVGGSNFLAKQLNAARDVLLKRGRRH